MGGIQTMAFAMLDAVRVESNVDRSVKVFVFAYVVSCFAEWLLNLPLPILLYADDDLCPFLAPIIIRDMNNDLPAYVIVNLQALLQ